ncbi:OmpA family protein [Parerythrobacter aurantius]|uniref:OmpA family protein n=1 Tax=Parerythrobacter aurantius TaxID=3127706 RepID=UPI003247384E
MKKRYMLIASAAILAAVPVGVSAQESASDLASTDRDTLRNALQMRYDAALAATLDDQVISANDARYTWASEAKVQCAIALGYLKSNTRDEVSISKCGYAYDQMNRRRMAPARPVPQPVQPIERPALCDNPAPGIIFFEFDSDVPGADAAQTIRIVAANAEPCGWRSFKVVGHTDKSGSDAYNDGLSRRRADAVASLMASLGIDRSRLDVSSQGEANPRVPTEDGVRNPQNRRVEITVSQ